MKLNLLSCFLAEERGGFASGVGFGVGFGLCCAIDIYCSTISKFMSYEIGLIHDLYISAWFPNFQIKNSTLSAGCLC